MTAVETAEADDMGNDRVLLYNIPTEEKKGLIRMAAYLCGLKCVEVPPEAQGQQLGALLGLPGHAEAEAPAEVFSDEMLVMETMSSAFLDALRTMGATVALKAIVTELNLSWSSARLCRELRRENEALSRAAARKAPAHAHPKKKH